MGSELVTTASQVRLHLPGRPKPVRTRHRSGGPGASLDAYCHLPEWILTTATGIGEYGAPDPWQAARLADAQTARVCYTGVRLCPDATLGIAASGETAAQTSPAAGTRDQACSALPNSPRFSIHGLTIRYPPRTMSRIAPSMPSTPARSSTPPRTERKPKKVVVPLIRNPLK
jgi:hypothetical protein